MQIDKKIMLLFIQNISKFLTTLPYPCRCLGTRLIRDGLSGTNPSNRRVSASYLEAGGLRPITNGEIS